LEEDDDLEVQPAEKRSFAHLFLRKYHNSINMSYRVTVEELRKNAPPLRMISLTAPDWLQAVDAVTEVLSKEDTMFQEEEAETREEPNDDWS
jgi:hypothetical protein